jgi:hypothetical protein
VREFETFIFGVPGENCRRVGVGAGKWRKHWKSGRETKNAGSGASAFWRLVLGFILPQKNKKLPGRNSLHDTTKIVAPFPKMVLPRNYEYFRFAADWQRHRLHPQTWRRDPPIPLEPRETASTSTF